MRGCFRQKSRQIGSDAAFPAYAGMFLRSAHLLQLSIRFPRVCGDVSNTSSGPFTRLRLSPRMRGCFCCCVMDGSVKVAFPAYAGMFPGELVACTPTQSFPRVCGDVSQIVSAERKRIKLSPRMRGCFSHPFCYWWFWCAFPAYAGMFPISSNAKLSRKSFPRVCGDVSCGSF